MRSPDNSKAGGVKKVARLGSKSSINTHRTGTLLRLWTLMRTGTRDPSFTSASSSDRVAWTAVAHVLVSQAFRASSKNAATAAMIHSDAPKNIPKSNRPLINATKVKREEGLVVDLESSWGILIWGEAWLGPLAGRLSELTSRVHRLRIVSDECAVR
jgi:hypothetical protein